MPDNLDRRSRLISLVYQVLSSFPHPTENTPDAEIYSQLGSAFYRKAADVSETREPTSGERREDAQMFGRGKPNGG